MVTVNVPAVAAAAGGGGREHRSPQSPYVLFGFWRQGGALCSGFGGLQA